MPSVGPEVYIGGTPYSLGTEVDFSRILLRGSAGQGIEGLTTHADGSGGEGSVTFDDPAAELDLLDRAWKTVVVKEPRCTDAPTLYVGWLGDRRWYRNTYKHHPARMIDANIFDLNVLLSMKLLTGGDVKRGEEDDNARMAWLLGSAYLFGWVDDLGLVNGPGETMEAFDYHGTYSLDVANDLNAPRSTIIFPYWSDDDNRIGMFFDQPSAIVDTSDLSISSVLADASSSVFNPYREGQQLERSGDDVYGLVRYVAKNFVIYRGRGSTGDDFWPDFPDPTYATRGVNVTNEKVGKLTTAQRFADRILDRDAVERDTLTIPVRLPADVCNLIRAGQRLQVKFPEFPGYEDWTYVRVEQRVIAPTPDRRDFYDLELLCSNFASQIGGGGGGGGGGNSGGGGGGSNFPPVTPPGSGPIEFCATNPSPGVAGYSAQDKAYYRGVFRGGIGHDPSVHITAYQVSGTVLAGSYVEAQLRIKWDGGTMDNSSFVMADLTGGIGADPNAALCWNNGALTACAGTEAGAYPASSHPVGSVNPAISTEEHTFEIWGLGVSSPDYGGSEVCVTVGKVYDQATGLEVPNELVPFDPDPAPPGSFIDGDTLTPAPDGSTDTFNTTSGDGYAPKSLHVEMNGSDLEEGRDYTESDADAGEVVFTDPPPTDAQIVIQYVKT